MVWPMSNLEVLIPRNFGFFLEGPAASKNVNYLVMCKSQEGWRSSNLRVLVSWRAMRQTISLIFTRVSLSIALMNCALTSMASAQQGVKIHMHLDGGYAADGVLFEPTDRKPAPAIILIPDELGLSERTNTQARQLIAQGFVVVEVDLYRGESANDAQRAQELSRALPPKRVMQDLAAAFSFLSGQPNVVKDRIGAFGWSSGGTYALRLASAEPRLHAVVSYGGTPPTDLTELKSIQASVFAVFVTRDNKRTLAVFERTMHKLGKKIQVKFYHAPDAEDAQHRIDKYLASTLNEPIGR